MKSNSPILKQSSESSMEEDTKIALITILPEFRSMIPLLRTEEFQQLEANLKADGCRDPLVLWRKPEGGEKILLDGHNRFDICIEHGISFNTVEIDLPDQEAAADWIDANQLGRRNLTPDQYSLLRGRRYIRAKRQGERSDLTSGQNGQKFDAAEQLAQQHGVSKRTIRRDGEFAEAVETIKVVDPEIETKVVSGTAPAKGAIVEAAKVIDKAEKRAKETEKMPLLGTKKDREAAEVLEKAKEQAEAILSGSEGRKITVAQAKREIAKAEKQADMKAKAEAVEGTIATDDILRWQVIVGDSLEVMRSLDPFLSWGADLTTPRLIFADPPYNIGIEYGDHMDDSMEQEDFLEWSEAWIRAAADLLAPDGSLWVMINDEWADIYGCLLRDAGLHRRAWIKWYETFGVNCSNNFNRCSRHIFYMVKDREHFVFDPTAVHRPSDRQVKYGDSRADPGGKIWDDVWGINPPLPRLVGTARERIPDFPTQLPLALLTAVVGCASEPGDLVLDPFNGSGTTGEAALRLKRRYIGIEKSAQFAELARLRLITAEAESRDSAVRAPSPCITSEE